MKSIVVGGGISGLVAAYRLQQAGVDVTLREAGARLGGKIETTPFAGLPAVDTGADAVAAIEAYAKRFGYGVVREYTGHGVGRAFHTGLIIPHYDAPEYDTVMEPGMVFTIEPMLTLGSIEWDVWDDDWTVVTRDRSLTAQFEHTLVVTERGAEILTLP